MQKEIDMPDEVTVEQLPGRELDAMVWLALHDREPTVVGCRYVDGDVQPHAGYPTGYISPPEYSTEWDKTRLVIEEMINKGFDFELNYYEHVGWIATFTCRFEWSCTAKETAECAICNAAVNAIRGESFPEEM